MKHWPHLKEVNYNGVFYADIDWSKDLHSLGPICHACGCDAAEGHGSSCEYLFENQTTPRGREFLRQQIRLALDREVQSKGISSAPSDKQ